VCGWQPFLEAKDSLVGKLAIIGVPWDGSASFRKGMRHAPDAIRVASQSIESYSAVFGRDIRDVDLTDLGNLPRYEDALSLLEALSGLLFKLHSNGIRTICIGGDHSITVGICSGLLKAYGKLQAIVFDAHSDWRDEYDGSKLSHACTIRRLSEMLGDEFVHVFGVRSFVGDEPMRLYRKFDELPCGISVDVPTHISIDLDVLDPSIMSAVGNPEPNGVGYGELLEALQKLREGRYNVVSIDVVELCPQYDNGACAVVAAKLIVECILGLMT
jgi:agmatinase